MPLKPTNCRYTNQNIHSFIKIYFGTLNFRAFKEPCAVGECLIVAQDGPSRPVDLHGRTSLSRT